MSYHTDFTGHFTFNQMLDTKTAMFINQLSRTRRVTHAPDKLIEQGFLNDYGVEGEWFVQRNTNAVLNFNTPPSTQPSLYLEWRVSDDKKRLYWNGAEKFYHYIEWLEYLIDNILKPKNYSLNGTVYFQGENEDDSGVIEIKNNYILVS